MSNLYQVDCLGKIVSWGSDGIRVWDCSEYISNTNRHGSKNHRISLPLRGTLALLGFLSNKISALQNRLVTGQ